MRGVCATAFLMLALTGCSDGDGSSSGSVSTAPAADTQPAGSTDPATTTATTPRPYTLAATRSCLVARGIAVSKIGSSDARLRELGDLAQQTSIEVRRTGEIVAVAFGNAELLRSLVRSPDNPYRLDVRRNVLVMYRPAASSLADLVRECLRP